MNREIFTMRATITVNSLIKNSSAVFDSALIRLKSHEINAEELRFKLALIQFFKNKTSEPCITNLLVATPDIPEHTEEIFIDRYKYIFSDLFYLSTDAGRLDQLTGWHSEKHSVLASLTQDGGFLNPGNSVDSWWAASMGDYYAHSFALTCIKLERLRYTKPEEKQISDDIQNIVEILTNALKEFGSKMRNDNTFHQPLKNACSQMALALAASSLSDEVKLQLTSNIVSRQAPSHAVST